MELSIIKNKHNVLIFIFCLLVSFATLLICTKSSPLYAFNDWVDANAYFTMGKGMMNGLVPFKDLFEQKGPYLYLIHGLAYLISNTSFTGVFIFEVLSFSVALFFAHKIITLYFDKKYSFVALPCLACLILSNPVFKQGDSAEEFCLPFMFISLYYFINYFKNIYPTQMSTKHLILNGAMAGIVFCIKYSLLGFWIGFMLSVFIALIINKKFTRAFTSCLYFLLGMFIPIVPWLIYFIINDGLYDFFYTYLYVNITSYAKQSSLSTRFAKIFIVFAKKSIHNLKFLCIALPGLIYFLAKKDTIPNILGKIMTVVTIILTIMGIYSGQSYKYYYLFILPFIIFGILFLLEILRFLISKFRTKLYLLLNIAIPISFITFTIFSFILSPNVKDMKYNKEDLFQFKFADIINKYDNPTLLNYDFIDYGVFTTTGVIPNTKYFEKPNIKYSRFPEILDTQGECIKNKTVDFVVCRTEENTEPDTNIKKLSKELKKKISIEEDLNKNYEVVSECIQEYENKTYLYKLYKLREL